MVLVSSRKTMQLHPLELVIRRCPVCLKDTEQDAFYAKSPDFSAEAMTPTTPQFMVKVVAIGEYLTNWYIVSKCRECGYLYKVSGIQQYRLKELKPPKEMEVNIALFCCDVCYNDEARYEHAEIFIRLSEGKNVYLCERHAAEAERKKGKADTYAYLIDRFKVWKINDAMPKAVQLDDGRVVALVGDRGYMEQILKVLSESGELPVQELISKLKENNYVHRTNELIESQINELIRLSLAGERKTGAVFKTRQIFLTDEGKAVAGKLR